MFFFGNGPSGNLFEDLMKNLKVKWFLNTFAAIFKNLDTKNYVLKNSLSTIKSNLTH